jgi:DNA-binding IclR family transcriptional regulator
MKPIAEYTRKLLTAFQESPRPSINVRELAEDDLDVGSNEFRFHMQLFEDEGFVQREDGEKGIGVVLSVDGLYKWSVLPLLLTASGQEFAAAIRDEQGFEAVKRCERESFAPLTVRIMRDVAVRALKADLVKRGFLSVA